MRDRREKGYVRNVFNSAEVKCSSLRIASPNAERMCSVTSTSTIFFLLNKARVLNEEGKESAVSLRNTHAARNKLPFLVRRNESPRICLKRKM
jgi:hypothetical protein